MNRLLTEDESSIAIQLPASFTAIADAFIEYWKAYDADQSTEDICIDRNVAGLCIAGGIKERNDSQRILAENYVYSALGLELSKPYVHDSFDQEKRQVISFSERPGHVYILKNPSLIGVLKIGFTCLTVDERVNQLSRSTSIPEPFISVASFKTSTPVFHEECIHEFFALRRMPGREFFSVTEDEAIAACSAIIGASS